MTLDIPVETAIRWVGHDGSDVVFPDLEEPMCRRGFHAQELIELAMMGGFWSTPYQLFPSTKSEGGCHLYPLYPSQADERCRKFGSVIQTTVGVLEGIGTSCRHAVAYDHGRIFDPDGREYDYTLKNCEAQGFYGKQLWILTRGGVDAKVV